MKLPSTGTPAVAVRTVICVPTGQKPPHRLPVLADLALPFEVGRDARTARQQARYPTARRIDPPQVSYQFDVATPIYVQTRGRAVGRACSHPTRYVTAAKTLLTPRIIPIL